MSYVFHGSHREAPAEHRITISNEKLEWPEHLFGEARIIDTTYDIELFKRWLAFCEKDHQHEEPKSQVT